MLEQYLASIPDAGSARNEYIEFTFFVVDSKPHVVRHPDVEHISTSYAERVALTIRMNTWRFALLLSAFSKRVEVHEHAVALHVTHYNFAVLTEPTKTAPAMAAGVADHVWTRGEAIGLIHAKPAGRSRLIGECAD